MSHPKPEQTVKNMQKLIGATLTTVEVADEEFAMLVFTKGKDTWVVIPQSDEEGNDAGYLRIIED